MKPFTATAALAVLMLLAATDVSLAQQFYYQPDPYAAERYRQQQIAEYRWHQQQEYYRQQHIAQQQEYYRQQQIAQQREYYRQRQMAEYRRQQQASSSHETRSQGRSFNLPSQQQVDRYRRYGTEAVAAYQNPYAYAGVKAQEIARRNIAGASRESTTSGHVLYAASGISKDDWKKHGWKGGPNSVVNQTERGLKKVGKVLGF